MTKYQTVLTCFSTLAATVLALGSVTGSAASALQSPATTCDRLASSPTDPDSISPGVRLDERSASKAASECEAALSHDPDNRRLKNQLIAARISQKYPVTSLIEILNDKNQSLDDIYPDSLYQIYRYSLSIDPKNIKYDWLEASAKLNHPMAQIDLFWAKFNDPVAHNRYLQYLSAQSDFILLDKVANDSSNRDLQRKAAEVLWMAYPAGYPPALVSLDDTRQVVQNLKVTPFNAIGRLSVSTATEQWTCTAQLVMNSQTIVTAGHCIEPGAKYYFEQGADLDDRHEAELYEVGDLIKKKTAHPSATPDETWDDWAVLNLKTPLLNVMPMGIWPNLSPILKGDWSAMRYWVAGYPADLFSANKMVFATGCGFSPSMFGAHYHESYRASTSCPSYHGMSGAAIMIVLPEYADKIFLVGLVTAGSTSEEVNYSTDITLSRSLFLSVCEKVNKDRGGSCDERALRAVSENGNSRR